MTEERSITFVDDDVISEPGIVDRHMHHFLNEIPIEFQGQPCKITRYVTEYSPVETRVTFWFLPLRLPR